MLATSRDVHDGIYSLHGRVFFRFVTLSRVPFILFVTLHCLLQLLSRSRHEFVHDPGRNETTCEPCQNASHQMLLFAHYFSLGIGSPLKGRCRVSLCWTLTLP